jgi:hypothetical protein
VLDRTGRRSRWATNNDRLSLGSAPFVFAASSIAASLIWHCTVSLPFIIVNANANRSLSCPIISPRVSGIESLIPVDQDAASCQFTVRRHVLSSTLCHLKLFRIKPEGLELPAPFVWQIAETFNTYAAGQATFNGGFDKIGRKERERDRHVDLTDTAFLADGKFCDGGRPT